MIPRYKITFNIVLLFCFDGMYLCIYIVCILVLEIERSYHVTSKAPCLSQESLGCLALPLSLVQVSHVCLHKEGSAMPAFVFLCCVCLFIEKASHSPGCPGTHCVDQAGFKLTDPRLRD